MRGPDTLETIAETQTEQPLATVFDRVQIPEVRVGPNPRLEFMESLPRHYQAYKQALAQDERAYTTARGQNTDEPGNRFSWRALNPHMTEDLMFENAVGYLIEAEALQFRKDMGGEMSELKESSLRGSNQKIATQFGPEGTASGQVIEELRDSVRAVIRSGASALSAKGLLRYTDYKGEKR